MKKWIGLYVVICLVALGILSCAAGLQPSKQVSFGAVERAGGYASQVIETKSHAYVLYQNTDEEKFSIVKADAALQGYEALGTVHSDGVYYLYRYQDGGKQTFAIAPVDAAKDEEEWTAPTFRSDGSFLAAGSDERAIYCSILATDGRTIVEYELPLDSMQGWENRAQTFCRVWCI